MPPGSSDVTMPELDGDDDWPDRDEMLVKTGDSLAEKGDAAGARACYQLAIDADHPYWAPYAAHHLGGMLAGQDDAAGARACYQLAIDSGHAEVSPHSAANLGILLAGQGDVGGARAAYQVAIDSGNAHIAALAALHLGVLLAGQGDVTGARAYYQLAINSGHADVAPFAAANLGILLAGQGDVAGARAAYHLAIDSGHPDVAPEAAANLASLTSRAADSGTATYAAGGGRGESRSPGENGSPSMLTNRERVGRGLEFLASGLGPYVYSRLTAASPGGDWTEALAARDRERGLAGRRYSLSDPRLLLRAMTEQWGAFRNELSAVERGFASELRDTGNKWAHGDAISTTDADRALDTMKRLLTAIGAASQASQIRSVRANPSESRRSREEQTAAADDYAARYEACRQRAIAAGALKPQSFSERAFNGMRYAGDPTYEGQPVMPYSETIYAQRKLEMWIDDCLNGRPFTKNPKI